LLALSESYKRDLTKASLVIFDNLAGMSPPTEMIKMGKRRSLSCERLLDEISKFSGKEGLKYL